MDSVALRGLTTVEHRWYAIQTTAGHENKVRSLIQRKIEQDPLPAEARAIRQALVPTQEVVEIKNGKKVNVERKIYPGYVLVEMLMTQETLHIINGIQGVIKFVGHDRLPQPLRADEVNRLLGIADEVVGVALDDLNVSRVAGSSLTSGGFNQAVESIKEQAAA